MTERDENGLFKEQGPSKGFDSESGKETAEKHNWSNRRKANLKRFGLWEKFKDE